MSLGVAFVWGEAAEWGLWYSLKGATAEPMGFLSEVMLFPV
jgi:hypothetical protein